MSRGRHVIKGRYCCTTWHARVTLKSRARTLEACHVSRHVVVSLHDTFAGFGNWQIAISNYIYYTECSIANTGGRYNSLLVWTCIQFYKALLYFTANGVLSQWGGVYITNRRTNEQFYLIWKNKNCCKFTPIHNIHLFYNEGRGMDYRAGRRYVSYGKF